MDIEIKNTGRAHTQVIVRAVGAEKKHIIKGGCSQRFEVPYQGLVIFTEEKRA